MKLSFALLFILLLYMAQGHIYKAKLANHETGDMDKLLNPDFGRFRNPTGRKADMIKLQDFYNFDYRYALKMTTREGEIDFDYYLNKNEPYMGAKMNMGMVDKKNNKSKIPAQQWSVWLLSLPN